MIFSDLLEETYSALVLNKVRSGLTMLGIIIGIGSVIAMVAIGQGAQNSIESSIQSIGSNLIIVSPGAPRGVGSQINAGRGNARTLIQSDVDAIQKSVENIQAISPEISSRYQIAYKGKNTNTSVVGTVSTYPSVRNITIADGSFLTDEQIKNMAKVAVLGPTTRDDLFGIGVDAVGQTIRIKQINFTVIGVTTAKGGSGFSNQDDMVFIPLSTAQHFLAGDSYVTTISIQTANQNVMADVQTQITGLLLERHKISDPTQADFNVLNQSDIVATAASVTGTFTLLLGAIAGISLLVGGIGIMNMMLTTVTERTREIGLRKAIGAQKRDISLQFLAEAVMLTFIGGVIGVLLGWGISLLVTKLSGIQTIVSITSVVEAFCVSAVIGIIFGYYPARRASRLSPIEALRYE